MNYSVIEKINLTERDELPQDEQQAFMIQALKQVCELESDSAKPRINDMVHSEYVCCDFARRELSLRFLAREWELNPMGTLHGGMITLMVDMTCGLLVRYMRASLRVVTLQISVNFLDVVHKYENIIVQANIDKLGKRVAFLHASVINEKTGKIAATATCTFM